LNAGLLDVHILRHDVLEIAVVLTLVCGLLLSDTILGGFGSRGCACSEVHIVVVGILVHGVVSTNGGVLNEIGICVHGVVILVHGVVGANGRVLNKIRISGHVSGLLGGVGL